MKPNNDRFRGTNRSVLAIVMDNDLRDPIREAARLEGLTQTAFARRHLLIAARKVIAQNTTP